MLEIKSNKLYMQSKLMHQKALRKLKKNDFLYLKMCYTLSSCNKLILKTAFNKKCLNAFFFATFTQKMKMFISHFICDSHY